MGATEGSKTCHKGTGLSQVDVADICKELGKKLELGMARPEVVFDISNIVAAITLESAEALPTSASSATSAPSAPLPASDALSATTPPASFCGPPLPNDSKWVCALSHSANAPHKIGQYREPAVTANFPPMSAVVFSASSPSPFSKRPSLRRRRCWPSLPIRLLLRPPARCRGPRRSTVPFPPYSPSSSSPLPPAQTSLPSSSSPHSAFAALPSPSAPASASPSPTFFVMRSAFTCRRPLPFASPLSKQEAATVVHLRGGDRVLHECHVSWCGCCRTIV